MVAPDYFSHTADNGNKVLSDGSAIIFPNVWDNYPAQWAIDYPADEWVVVPQMTSDENKTYSNIMSPIDTYVKEQRVKFIKGERSFDEWDEYVNEVKNMGDIKAAMDIRNSKIK